MLECLKNTSDCITLFFPHELKDWLGFVFQKQKQTKNKKAFRMCTCFVINNLWNKIVRNKTVKHFPVYVEGEDGFYTSPYWESSVIAVQGLNSHLWQQNIQFFWIVFVVLVLPFCCFFFHFLTTWLYKLFTTESHIKWTGIRQFCTFFSNEWEYRFRNFLKVNW